MSSTPTPEPAELDEHQEHDDPPAAGGPEPFMRGKFSLYETEGGGIHLAYWTEQHGEGHRDFPGKLVKMMSSGRLSKMFGA